MKNNGAILLCICILCAGIIVIAHQYNFNFICLTQHCINSMKNEDCMKLFAFCIYISL